MEITLEEYTKIYYALSAKADALANAYPKGPISPGCFFSTRAFALARPSQERKYDKPGVRYLYHFLPKPCFEPIGCYEKTICLAEVSENGEITYHLNEHIVGRCPWKKKTIS